ncbi:hypothetical protein E7T06_20165 [Deinococcus sp. Arct2-2]|uniref:hypothetical protein n=1 Tax=Deinococcus sp. Arct2-2 TaxID=2568653 RepID=UPI0010A4F09B|nr:hypothetical protein [Deinococcus sp. Arct2-2]THF67617.1 hypothetical protein E7T06_20165 [Deinococcus sp. Arct2-2]
MNVYMFAAAFGLLGLMVMAALGLAHGHSPGGRQHGGNQSGGHPAGDSHIGTHGRHASAAHPHAAHQHAGIGESWLGTLMLMTSPRVVFSVVLGFGLVGLLLTGVTASATWPAVVVFVLAAVGGLAFERWLTGPYWNALMTFQSRPARSLGSAVMSAGQAVTDFDRSGNGLVQLEFEGEIRQLLALQTPAEHTRGVRIKRGDRVRLEAIDEERNRCTVSSLG